MSDSSAAKRQRRPLHSELFERAIVEPPPGGATSARSHRLSSPQAPVRLVAEAVTPLMHTLCVPLDRFAE
jgi:hypothetical protein